jgi:hypothetical protein
MSLSPIILFCYNRHDKVIEVIKNLQENYLAKDSELFVFCDGPKSEKDLIEVRKTHEVLDKISGFKNVVIEKRSLNFGLANSVIYGVNKVLEKHQKLIVLEDDIIVSKSFLKFMNEALDFYENDEKLFSICAFNFDSNLYKKRQYLEDVFFVKKRGSSWGWATWKNRWQKVNFDITDYEIFKNNKAQIKLFNQYGSNLSEMLERHMLNKIDSWFIRVTYHQFRNNLGTIFPVKSLAKNIGFDGLGTHKDNNMSLNEKDISLKCEWNFKDPSQLKGSENVERDFIKISSIGSRKKFSNKTSKKIINIMIGFLIAQLLNLIIWIIF